MSSPPPSGYGPPPPSGYGPPPPAYGPGPVVPTRRPGTLTAAGVITIAMSSVAFIGMALSAIVFFALRDDFEDVDRLQDFSADIDVDFSTFVTVIGILSVMLAVLSAVAVVLGAMLLQDKRVRIPLVVVSAIAIVPSILSAPIGLIWVVAEVVVIVFCFVGGATAWFEAQAYSADRAGLQR
jgi:hypothetical protein